MPWNPRIEFLIPTKEFNCFIGKNVENKTVLEISDPIAKIARLAKKFKSWYIVEPNPADIEIENVKFIKQFFDENKSVVFIYLPQECTKDIYTISQILKNIPINIKQICSLGGGITLDISGFIAAILKLKIYINYY